MKDNPMDLIALAVALFATLVNKEVAGLVGPYAAIAVLAIAGAMVSLSGGIKSLGAWEASKFFTGRVVIAVAVTVMLAELLQWALPDLPTRKSIGPIAFILGWVKDYNAILQWGMETIRGMLQRKADGK